MFKSERLLFSLYTLSAVSLLEGGCTLLMLWLRLVGWPLRTSSILVSYKGIVVKMPNQTGCCCCFFFIMRKWNAFFEVVIDDTWRWMLTRFFHWQQITTRKNNNKAQKAFSHKGCAIHTNWQRIFLLYDNSSKEIDIIHRLFLVIAMYCQASSNQLNESLNLLRC